MPLIFLTEDDRQILLLMVDDYKQRRVNAPGHSFVEAEDSHAPECYIAWPPSGGIPALTAVGAVGPDGGNDQPGSATCSIYIINDMGTAELQPIASFDRTVYNLSESKIPQQWIAVQRTKYGKWVAVTRNQVLLGILDESLSQGSSTTMSVYQGDPLADTGVDITVYDWFLGSGESIASGKKIKAEFICGKWYVTAAEC